MRQALKQLLKTGIRWSPVPLLAGRGRRLVPVLRYHSVDDTGSSISTPPAVWREHLRFIRDAGCEVLSLRELFARDPDDREHALVMTFDDGYRNNHELAFPALRALGWSATVFVVPDCVGVAPRWLDGELGAAFRRGAEALDAPWPELARRAELDEDYVRGHLPQLWALGRERCLREYHALHRMRALPMMDWDEIVAASRSGIEIGSHTMSHCHLSDLGGAARESKAVIEERIQSEVGFFCYPYGNVPDDSPERVRAAGYRGACTCERGFFERGTDPFTVKRVEMEAVASRGDLDFLLGARHRGLVDRLLS